MNKALEKVFERASRLPEKEQDRLAAWIESEMESEAVWTDALSRSGEALQALADEALDENRRDETEPLDPDSL